MVFISALAQIVLFVILFAAALISAFEGVKELRSTPAQTRDTFIVFLYFSGAALWAVLAFLTLSVR